MIHVLQIVLILFVSGCSTKSIVSKRPSTLSLSSETVNKLTIVSQEYLSITPPYDWKAYINRQLMWYSSSNSCVAIKLKYYSTVNCWLWYNNKIDDGQIVQFSNNTNDSVRTSTYIQVGDELPAGDNTIITPCPKNLAGYFLLRPYP